MSHREDVTQLLTDLLSDLSGVVIQPKDRNKQFLELGFDSLILTQVSAALKKRLKINIRFRRLLEDVSTLDLLAAYCEDKIPQAEPKSPAQPAQPQTSIPQQSLSQTPFPAPQFQPQSVSAEKRVVVKAPERPKAPQVGADDQVAKVRFGPYKPIQKGDKGALTEVQSQYLDQLVQQLIAKTPTSKKVAQENREVQADPRTVAGFRQLWKEIVYQVVTEKSKGSRVWDVDGNEYVDITMGFGVGFLGHSPKFVTDAVLTQLHKGFEIGPQADLAGKVARKIRDLTGMERVSFCNTGSEAVMAALRMARTLSGRDKIVYFSGDYHGVFDEVLARPQNINGDLHTMPAAPGITEDSVANAYILDYGTDASLEFIRQNKDDIAAVLVETVQSRHPENRPFAFIKSLREITAEHEIALVFDEVITGFRVHPSGMQRIYGVKPDLSCYGKIIGGGYPIGVVAGDKRYMDAIDGGFWQYGDNSIPEADLTFFAGTFVRHPLALAAADAVIDFLNDKGGRLQGWMNERTSQFAHDLNRFFEAQGVPIKINHYSSWFRVEVPTDYRFPDIIFYNLLLKGVYVFTFAQNCFFSIAHSDEDIEFIKKGFMETVIEMQAGGFLPQPADQSGIQPIPLSEAQKGIWYASELTPQAAPAYNESFSLRLSGPLRTGALIRAVETVAGRYETLHMRFLPDGSGQVPVFDRRLFVERVDYQNAPDPELALKRLMKSEMQIPFDLERGPLVRLKLVRVQENEHVLLWFANHIVYDGWSAVIVIDEIRKLYNGVITHRPVMLPEPDRYADYVSWEQEEKSSPEGQEVLQYWLNEFSNPPAPLDLPTDMPRPAEKSYGGASVHYVFKAGLLGKLRDASRQYKTSLFALMLAAYKGLLYRLSNGEDVVVGIHTAGQPLAGLPNMVSHCVSILPVRTQPNGEMNFASYVDQVKKKLLDAQDQQPFTFEQILKHINIPRDPSRSPLVEVLFNLDRKVPEEQFIGLRQTIREIEKEAVNFDLFLNLYEEGDDLKADFIYSTDIYQESTMVSWLERFDLLLETITAQPNLPMKVLPLMSTGQREKVLYTWNKTEVDYQNDTLIHSLFEEQVRKTPDIPAIVYKDTFLSFKQLNEQSNQMARYLQDQGVEPGDNVGISMRRSLDMIVSLLAVIKAGGCYVALDPSYPADRLSFMIKNSEIKTLITKSDLMDLLVPDQAQRDGLSVILMDTDKGAFANMATDDLGLEMSSESPLYILYTSGSTGVPKGVIGHHRGALNRLSWNWREYPFIEEEVGVQKTTLNFVDSVWEIWGTLLKGIPLILIPDDVIGDPKQFVPILVNFKIHRLIMVPSILKIMLDDYPDLGERLPDLKYLHFSGEPVSLELYQQFKKAVPNGVMLNLYGCSELAADATCHDDIRDPISDKVYIGRPIANTKIYILDEARKPVPVGVSGEIYVSGDPVAHGYYGRLDLTAERFFPDPFVDQTGRERPQMMFKTGDFGRYAPNGLIEYLGRSDSQVKIRGIRIELGEIESRLNRHPLIKQSIILVKEDRLGDPALAAYLKVEPEGMQATNAEWRDYLNTYLPKYMVPQFYIPMEEFPHTPNGKIDRVGLPAPTTEIPDGVSVQHIEPRDDIERMLADIWKSSLALEEVSVEEDFFDLGGHSVLAVRMFREVRESFGVSLDLTLLFRKATIAALADEIRTRIESISAAVMEDEVIDGEYSVLEEHAELLDQEGETIEADAELYSKTQKLAAGRPKVVGDTLVEIQAGNPEQLPFFCVHGGGGNVLFLKPWLKYLADQPFYAFQSRGIDGKSTHLFASFTDIATHYISEMKQVQPHGPYLIGGYSIGGTIAFEMARQLTAAGETIGLLALLDTFHPTIREHQHTMQDRLRYLATEPVSYLSNAIQKRFIKPAKRTGSIDKIQKLVDRGEDIPIELREVFVESYLYGLSQEYDIKPYSGSGVLLCAEEVWSVYSHAGSDRGWRQDIQDLIIHEIPGNHFSLLQEPNLGRLVTSLIQYIRAAQADLANTPEEV